jgi:peptidoglycan/LPS O-acetylase OafA/YrhL
VNKLHLHLPFLDRFRGVAILAVLGLHLFSGMCKGASSLAGSAHHVLLQAFLFGLYELLSLGKYGVAIFFVVSGFCIHLSYRRSAQAGWWVFYTRRVFRIYPAYLFSLFLFILVLPTTRWPAGWLDSTRSQINLFLHLILAHNLLPQTFASIEKPYWSLAIEFQLYLLFPLLLMVARQIGWRQMLIAMAFVEIVSRLGLTITSQYESNLHPASWWGWVNLSPFSFWFSWAIGAALAEAYVQKQTLPFATGPLPHWMWPLAVVVFHNTPYLTNFTFPVAAFATVRFMAYFLARETGRPQEAVSLPLRFLTFIGVISYSLYLIHLPLFNYFMKLPNERGGTSIYALECAYIIGALVAVIAASYLFFHFIEKPGIRLGKKLVDSLR